MESFGHRNTDPLYTTFKTYLAFDWSFEDKGSYPAYTEVGVWRVNHPTCGPGAAHPAVVNHLFADGSVNALSKDIDVSVYMFLVTRGNHDPSLEPD